MQAENEQSNDVTPQTGDQLAERVLLHPFGGVKALIDLAGGQETEWIEFKAATRTRPEDKEPHENDADSHWHVVRASIAFLNTRGGIIFIGVKDDGTSVGLQASHRNGELPDIPNKLKKFVRGIIDSVWYPQDRRWETGNSGTWLLKSPIPPDHLEPMDIMLLDDKHVLPILVHPLPANTKLCLVSDTTRDRDVLLVRDPGAQGRVSVISDFDVITDYQDKRRVTNPLLYGTLWKSFLRDFQATPSSLTSSAADGMADPPGLNDAILSYRELLRKHCAEPDLLFIPLDADEEFEWDTTENICEPMADEYLADEMDWKDSNDEPLIPNPSSEDANDESFREPLIARRGGVFSLLATEPRAVLLGEPGGGKTTCLKHLALQSAAAIKEKGMLTLFVPLSRYRQGGDLWPLLRRCTRTEKTDGITLAMLEWLAKNRRLRILLDAVNECPTEHMATCVEEIRNLLRQYPDMSVVITSRSLTYREEIGLPVFTVRPMDGEQQKQFLLVHMKGDPQRADEIYAQLMAQPGGEEFAANPLILRLVVEAVRGGQSLPNGRARLYRQFIERWYEREYRKAKNSGRPLIWTRDQTLSALARLAFEGRRAGFRATPIDRAITIVHEDLADPAAFFERMGGQGLLLRCDPDENSVDYLHETFQEYLAAEFILRHPDILKGIPHEDAQRWAMVFAYAIELNPAPHADVLLSIAQIDPWIAGCAENAAFLADCTDLPVGGNMSVWFSMFLKSSQSASQAMQWPSSALLQWCNPAVRYLLIGRKEVRQRWDVLTDHLIALGMFRNILELAESDWPMSSRQKQHILEKWIAIFTPLQAVSLVRKGWANTNDFAVQLQEWIKTASLYEAVQLVEAGCATKEDFTARLHEWMKTASPCEAVPLLEAGWVAKEDLTVRLEEWTKTASAHEAVLLLKSGCATKNDFTVRLEKWMKTASLREAVQLVKSGCATKEDFTARLHEWTKTASLTDAVLLVRAGWATKEDFTARLHKWTKTASPTDAALLVRAGWTTNEDFTVRLEEWIRTANPNQAVLLVQAGWATKDDFTARLHEWIKTVNPHQAVPLVEAGLATKDDFTAQLHKWIKTANPNQALLLVQAGWATKDDFTARLHEWMKTANPHQAVLLVQERWANKDDFTVRLHEWKKTVKPNQAVLLVQAGLAIKDDFALQLQEWKKKAMTTEATLLVRAGWATAREFRILLMQTAELERAESRTGSNLEATLYTNAALEDPEERVRIECLLRDTKWEMTVISKISNTGYFGFLQHPLFPDNVHFNVRYLEIEPGTLQPGDKVEVKVTIRNTKDGKAGYSANKWDNH